MVGISGVGNHSYDRALQRGALQQPLANKVHVPRGVHAKSDSGTRKENSFMCQQQRQTARYLHFGVACHCAILLEVQ